MASHFHRVEVAQPDEIHSGYIDALISVVGLENRAQSCVPHHRAKACIFLILRGRLRSVALRPTQRSSASVGSDSRSGKSFSLIAEDLLPLNLMANDVEGFKGFRAGAGD